jgi:S-formylglutathione hydrolase
MAVSAQCIKSNACFGGIQYKFKHASRELKCEMTFSVFVPGQAQASATSSSPSPSSYPVLYYLSGLTCTDDNVVQKSGIQRGAARCNVAVVCPDTSPRGLGYPGEDDSWDFGTGAGFYVNATTSPWKEGYRMDAYVTSELPAVLAATPELSPHLNLKKASIMGHSMGGHGALVLALRNPGMYASVSAFAPICHPSVVPWGKKAFGGYLGDDEEAWRSYDACALVSGYSGEKIEVLMDTGTADEFLEEQLRVEDLVASAAGNDRVAVTSRMNEGYDHSYFTVATFVEDHVAFHAARLV